MLAMDVAVSLSSGTPVLQHHDFMSMGKKRVAYVYAEQGSDMWEVRAKGIAKVKQVTPELFLLSGYDLQLTKPGHLDALLTTLIDIKAEVVILDPLVVVFRLNDENAASEVAKYVREPLQTLIEHGITPIVVHHASKAQSLSNLFTPTNAYDLVRGSGDLTAMLGAVIGLWKDRRTGFTKAMVDGRMTGAAPFMLKYGDEVDVGDSDAAVSIEDLLSQANSIKPLQYFGPWVDYKEGGDAWTDALPNHPFDAGEAGDLWKTGTTKTYRLLDKMTAKGNLVEHKSAHGGRMKTTWKKTKPTERYDDSE
jgi:hypothetical protein